MHGPGEVTLKADHSGCAQVFLNADKALPVDVTWLFTILCMWERKPAS